MVWMFDKTESTYSAEFPKSKVRIVVEGDEFQKDGHGKEIDSAEFLPLIEGRYYHFEIKGEGRLSGKSSFVRSGGAKRHGSIAPGTAVGYGRLYLEGAETPEQSLGVEVASDVVSYKKDYQDLLRQLTEDIADLQMQCSSCVQGLVKPNPHEAAKNDVQRFFFLLGLVGNYDFDAAMRQIVERPQVQLVEVETEVDVRHAARLGSFELRQLTSSPRRIPLPRNLKGRYPGLTSLPERIVTKRNVESVDTPENRFVKYAVNFFLDRLRNFKRILQEKKREGASMVVEVDIDAAVRMLSRWSAHEFFKGVGPLMRMPTSSVVLQRREGYREVLKKWLQFQAGTQLVWKNGEDVYAANQRKMSALYEYWCFFRLLKIVGGLFSVKTKDIADKMIGVGSDGLSLKLKEGKTISLDGTFDSGRTGARFRRLAVEFSYNRTFSAKGKEMSWTLPMRPDYTLAFRPLGLDMDEAIKNDLVTYVHFDAKYKARDLEASLKRIGKADYEEETVEEASTDEDAVSRKDVKRVDILKMHAYRDAIKRTGGAYVLYPGTEQSIKREEEEILPGLGAFQLSPSHDSSEKIKGFLSGVAKHLCDRVTRWENYTYRAYQIYKQSRAEFLAERDRVEGLTIPDYDEKETRDDRRVNLDAATAERYLDPDRYISVELKEAEKALKWAYEHNVFILEKKKWDELGKPGPAKVTLISVAWHPPINLIVQRFVYTMQGWMVQGKYPSCPYAFPTQKDRDREYLVWEVRAIDTKTLETRLQKSASAH